MKKIKLDDLAAKYRLSEYKELYSKVMALIEKRKVKPVKASGINGKSPALYREYWIVDEKQDTSRYLDELNYEITPAISTDYYRVHIDQYIQDRQWILLLNDYIRTHKLMTQMSENERSFDIWHREKFLKQEQGKKILKRCGLETDFLNFYRTTEPVAYYSATRKTPQNLLIVENKDTFYSMRKHLIAENDKICGEQIGTLIYGAGKRIASAFSDFDISGEPYMMAPDNIIFYFGDFDYEGFLTAFVILSSLLYYMRRDETDIFADRNEGKVLVMDNPFAQTNAEHLLKPLMDMADKMNTQLICFTGIGGDSIYGRFDNIYVLNLVASNLRGGMQYLRGEHRRGTEEETLVSSHVEVITQQSLLF